jgi:hypothetical protein
MANQFIWCVGAADIAGPCPSDLAADADLKAFFSAPNDARWGPSLPRHLYHESLHFWQLVSSRYLQLLVIQEWERLRAFEDEGKLSLSTAWELGFGTVASGEPFSVRDLVECLARFWDVHTRGATRLSREEADALGVDLASIDAVRPGGAYSSTEFDAVMQRGADCKVYAEPYRWMLERAKAAPTVQALPGSLEKAAIWAVSLLLPIAGFLALNTEEPVPAFKIAFERGLAPDAITIAAQRRDLRCAIQLDWLDFFDVLSDGLFKALKRRGHYVWISKGVGFGALDNPAFLNHPVYRHLRSRMEALDEALYHQRRRYLFNPPRDDPEDIDQALLFRELQVTASDRWPVFAFPGEPNFRSMLGGMFAPPVVRFDDATLPATASAFSDWPWPVDGNELAAAVAEAERRFDALYRAEAAARFGLPPDSFVPPSARASQSNRRAKGAGPKDS